jgi:hypothetical protein
MKEKNPLLVSKPLRICLDGESCEEYMYRMIQLKKQDPEAYNQIEMYGTP